MERNRLGAAHLTITKPARRSFDCFRQQPQRRRALWRIWPVARVYLKWTLERNVGMEWCLLAAPPSFRLSQRPVQPRNGIRHIAGENSCIRWLRRHDRQERHL